MNNNDLKYFGNYRGKVLATDAAEIDKLGRIKAEIYPMLIGEETARTLEVKTTGIKTEALPWIYPAPSLVMGSGIGYGCFAIPKVGTYIWVFFEAGDINQPVYFAEAIDKIHGLPAARLIDYPNRKIIRTSAGIEIILDDTTGDVIITGTGDVIITGTGDVIVQGANVRINPL